MAVTPGLYGQGLMVKAWEVW